MLQLRNNIKSSKLLCYPNGMIFTDYTANKSLQSLCDHTAHRLCQVQNDFICMMEQCDLETFHSKAGLIASTGQNIYKEKMSVDGLPDLEKKESSFLSYLVPLQITTYVGENLTVIWRNPKPSSTFYCRPLRFKFEKESTNLILIEEAALKDEMSNIVENCVELSKCNKFHSILWYM